MTLYAGYLIVSYCIVLGISCTVFALTCFVTCVCESVSFVMCWCSGNMYICI